MSRTCKTYVEVAVKVEYEWDDDRLVVLSCETADQKSSELDILSCLTSKQIAGLEGDCLGDWQERMKQEEER